MTNYNKLSTSLSLRTYKSLSSVKCSAEDVEKIIQDLDPYKTYRHDNISIRTLKIFSSTICKPLEITCSQAPTSNLFPSEWRKGNIVPIHKK